MLGFWRTFLVVAMTAVVCGGCAHAEGTSLDPWTLGYLDLYHISTGRGNSAYMIFPDGTTMLVDAGDVNAEKMRTQAAPLQLADAKPNPSKSPGEWIAEFVRAVTPRQASQDIDYAIITHYHEDHYGHVDEHTPWAICGKYKLSGITAVGDAVPIHALFDRGYPTYDLPLDLATLYGASFDNYLAFVRFAGAERGMRLERIKAGRADQIVLLHQPERFRTFSVRNVKVNGWIWTGEGNNAVERLTVEQVRAMRPFTENPLSIALKIDYGAFSYYTGGDNTGLSGLGIPSWFDVETTIAQAVGHVSVATLDHHGNRDATNEAFLALLRPRVMVQQCWISDEPGGEVVHRMASQLIYGGPRDVFATGIVPAAIVAMGPTMTNLYKSFDGHVLIRVSPGGASFKVLVLDDRHEGIHVLRAYGPYTCN